MPVKRFSTTARSATLREPGRASGRWPADEDHAHAAALGDVDDLLLRGAAEDRHAVLRGGEAHHDVERLGVDAAVGADDGELADRNAGQLLHDPAVRDRPGPCRGPRPTRLR